MSGVSLYSVWAVLSTDQPKGGRDQTLRITGQNTLPGDADLTKRYATRRSKKWASFSFSAHPQSLVSPSLPQNTVPSAPARHRNKPGHHAPVSYLISPFLPLAFAHALLEEMTHLYTSKKWRYPTGPAVFFSIRRVFLVARVRRRADDFLYRFFPQLDSGEMISFESFTSTQSSVSAYEEESGVAGLGLQPDDDEVLDQAKEVLATRALFTHELERALAERGMSVYRCLNALLDPLVKEGLIIREPGVRYLGSGVTETGVWACSRCLSKSIGFYPCHRCGLDACPRCDDCSSLGPSTGCMALYHMSINEPSEEERAKPRREVRVSLPFELSPAQKRLSRHLAASKRPTLIWAACGAGKTEVTFQTIADVVSAGGRVLFAVPRRDVVAQLGTRLDEAFPDAKVAALYGGTPIKYDMGDIVVATVHQALRFRHAFQLVVLDEADAFPLNVSPWLLQGIERAMAPSARAVLMTATPPEALRHRSEKGEWDLLTLAERPHGKPLPVPEILCNPAFVGSQGELRMADVLGRLLNKSRLKGRRVLVFVPSVQKADSVLIAICERGWRRWSGKGRAGHRSSLERPAGPSASNRDRTPKGKIAASVHANDLQRAEKMAAMEEGQIDVLVSTTVLERGITLPFLDTVVYDADHERVFDDATLVQMAGRVGRKLEDPTGSVIFLAARKTPAMARAVQTIRSLNAAAGFEEGEEDEGVRGSNQH